MVLAQNRYEYDFKLVKILQSRFPGGSDCNFSLWDPILGAPPPRPQGSGAQAYSTRKKNCAANKNAPLF
jgi:hypothetical protein